MKPSQLSTAWVLLLLSHAHPLHLQCAFSLQLHCLKTSIVPSRMEQSMAIRTTITFRPHSSNVIRRNDKSLLVMSTSIEQQEHDPQPSKTIEMERTFEKVYPMANIERIRKVQRIERFARLPVWPVVNGVIIWLIGNILGPDIAAKLENTITGRVCPNFYQYTDTSPYIMLVHHCHNFALLDPVRYIQRTFFPEGFPAHPHRGFITITYILHGGFIHRDSQGSYQLYGNDSPSLSSSRTSAFIENRYKGKHTQWLSTGRGMLHEEMFDIPNQLDLNHLNIRQELYQIWLNVPAKYKMDEPYSVLLGGDDETPVVYGDDGISKTLVLAGAYNGRESSAPCKTKLVLFHVTLQPGAMWQYNLPSAVYETAFIYIRQGSLRAKSSKTMNDANENAEIVIPVQNTAYFDKRDGDVVSVQAGNDEEADFMFLAGEPIREPCYASGSMVMNYPNEIEIAYNDYQKGLFGIPWDHRLSNEEWKAHVEKTKNR